jgi:hypothetical protein
MISVTSYCSQLIRLNKVPLKMTRYHVPDTKEGCVVALRAERNIQRNTDNIRIFRDIMMYFCF